MIDSRDFLMAKKRAEQEVLLPPGPKVVVTGGLDFNDHRLIWAKLDPVHEKHPDMVLIHGKSRKGAEKIASLWPKHYNVPQIGSDNGATPALLTSTSMRPCASTAEPTSEMKSLPAKGDGAPARMRV